MLLIIFILSFALIFSFLIWQYVLNIYEVDFLVEPKELFTDNKSIVRIEAIPINSFGKRAPFRQVKTEFKILEGFNYIEVVYEDTSKGILIIRSIGQEGKVQIKISTNYSLIPTILEILIVKNLA
ncbi:MAG: hypothetical protein NTX22_17395 [Ignavibacteriales bacterium]|nr:hypothetical protein [Ignavibacteriales bacterium]